jgi:thermostable 8-oxoguanine DNA glycosylase
MAKPVSPAVRGSKIRNIRWKIEPWQLEVISDLQRSHAQHSFVTSRIERNIYHQGIGVDEERVWRRLVCCLLTSQQKVGPGTHAQSVIDEKPFPLRLEKCKNAKNLKKFAGDFLQRRGLRFHHAIGSFIEQNLEQVDTSVWGECVEKLTDLLKHPTPAKERFVARWIQSHFIGFGPKQSRNFLQWMGLARHEVPIDSRFTRWFRSMKFPRQITPALLSSERRYCAVLDAVHKLCEQAEIVPCVLDALVFVELGKA